MTSPLDLTIRAATAADMDAVGRLAAMLVRDFHAFDSQRFLEPTPDTAGGYGEFLGTQIGKRDTHVIVAERSGTVVGYAYCGIEGYDWMVLRGPAGVLHDIVVDPKHRRDGIGVALLNAALAWLTERSAPRIVLNTANGNVAAQRFFEKAGFRRTMVEMTRESSG